MSLTLHFHPLASYCWKALIALYENDTPFTPNIVNLQNEAERNALRMHADALAADPPLLYWQPPTVACLHALEELRAAGIGAWATIDAGPHVVAICASRDADRVGTRLRAVPGVADVLLCAAAGGARLLP